jgi:hypothetical protein
MIVIACPIKTKSPHLGHWTQTPGNAVFSLDLVPPAVSAVLQTGHSANWLSPQIPLFEVDIVYHLIGERGGWKQVRATPSRLRRLDLQHRCELGGDFQSRIARAFLYLAQVRTSKPLLRDMLRR